MKTKLAIDAEKMRGGGVVSFLVKLIGGQTIALPGYNYSRKDLISEWNGGGKKIMEVEWRDKANLPTGNSAPIMAYNPEAEDGDSQYEDEIRSGKHEWISTNMIAYVVEHAVTHGDAALGHKWLTMAEVLRTPTRLVVLKPADKDSVAGHVSAVFKRSADGLKYTQQTKGQGPFHDDLRTVLRNNLSATRSNPDQYRADLMAKIEEKFWYGQTLAQIKDADPCIYYYNSGVAAYTSWGPTMGDMRQSLANGWKVESQNLVNAFTAILSKPNSTVTLGHSAQQLMRGVVYPGDDGEYGMDLSD